MKGEIEKNWDEMARVYEDFTEKDDSYSYAIEWPCIQKMLPPLNNKRILDLGCSTGRYSFSLKRKIRFPLWAWIFLKICWISRRKKPG